MRIEGSSTWGQCEAPAKYGTHYIKRAAWDFLPLISLGGLLLVIGLIFLIGKEF